MVVATAQVVFISVALFELRIFFEWFLTSWLAITRVTIGFGVVVSDSQFIDVDQLEEPEMWEGSSVVEGRAGGQDPILLYVSVAPLEKQDRWYVEEQPK